MAIDYLEHVRTESDRFAAALRDTDPGARVPSCPDWSAADLLWHLAEVHYMWAAVVARRVTDDDAVEAIDNDAPPRPDDYDDLHRLYARTTDDMIAALAAADDAEPVWTWASDQSVGFVRRFQAHEAMIHRVDAELAAGRTPTGLPAELADDGIDVVLRFQKTWRPGWADWVVDDAHGRIRTTDTHRRWTLRTGTWSGHSPDSGKDYDGMTAIELIDDDADADRSGATPDFTISAPATDLDAWLWHRPGFGEVTITGDGAERFMRLVKEGVQ